MIFLPNFITKFNLKKLDFKNFLGSMLTYALNYFKLAMSSHSSLILYDLSLYFLKSVKGGRNQGNTLIGTYNM